MKIIKFGMGLVLFTIILFCIISCGNRENENVEAFIFELETTDMGEEYYILSVYQGTDSEIVVPAEYNGLPVKEIGNNAFYENYSVESLIISEGIVVIGEYAFARSDIKVIEIPASITVIGKGAFREAEKLEKIVLPNRVDCLREGLFEGCISLADVSIPEGVVTIETNVFAGCESLESITIPSSVSNLSHNVFYGASDLEYMGVKTNLKKIVFLGESRLGFYAGGNDIEVVYLNGIGDGAPEEDMNMVLKETEMPPYYLYQDRESQLWGIFDKDKKEIVLNAVYEEIGDFSEANIAPAKRNGYWGYINCLGEVVIDFYFDKADSFIGNNASVYCEGSGRGVIDADGTYILKPKYASIDIYEDYIVGWLANGFCEVYNSAGKIIASKSVEGQQFAKVHFENGLVYAGLKGGGKYEVYDSEGIRWTGVKWDQAKNLSDVLYVSLPINGVHILYCAEKVQYLNYYQDKGMRLADKWFNLLNDKLYTEVSNFNALGLAVAEENYSTWFVLKKDGSAFKELPNHKIYDLVVRYTYANDYLACCHVSVGMTGGTHYGVVDLKTDRLKRWSEVTPVDGTNCIIVTDEDTGLKGLYDENKLVLESIYQDIKYENGTFRYIRGAVEELYVPIEQEKTIQILKEAQSYADAGDYTSALKHLKNVRVPTASEVVEKKKEFEAGLWREVLQKAEECWINEEYVEAIKTVDEGQWIAGTDDIYQANISEYRERYCDILLTESERMAQNGEYEQAISHLQEGMRYLGTDTTKIEAKIEEYKDKSVE